MDMRYGMDARWLWDGYDMDGCRMDMRYGMAVGWICDMGRMPVGCGMDMIWDGCRMAVGWIWDACRTDVGWIRNGMAVGWIWYGMDVGWI